MPLNNNFQKQPNNVPGKVRVVNSRPGRDHDDGPHDDVKLKARGARRQQVSHSLPLSFPLSLPFFTQRLPLLYDDVVAVVIATPDLGHRARERAGEEERGNERVCRR